MAAPGNPNIKPDDDLVAIWRTMDGERFQNYKAYFTILDTGDEPISHKWFESLIEDHENNLHYAPNAWKEFIEKGRNGIKALKSPIIPKIPTTKEQLDCNGDKEGRKCVDIIYNHYDGNATGFEACAIKLIKMMDSNFCNIELTPPRRDGGRDAIGYYAIATGGKTNRPLKIDCALEAKCYAETNGVGVKNMSRLISRIRYRQFGIMVTTSYVDSQAYREVIEDGHPILVTIHGRSESLYLTRQACL